MKKKLLIHVIFPLFLGGILYILFRSNSLNMFQWFEWIGLAEFIEMARQKTTTIELKDWIIFSLPNGLWLYALINMVVLIWDKQINNKNALWFVIPIVLGVGSELGQYIGIITGTFDSTDIFICLIATIIPFLTIKQKIIKPVIPGSGVVKHFFSVIGFVFFFDTCCRLKWAC